MNCAVQKFAILAVLGLLAVTVGWLAGAPAYADSMRRVERSISVDGVERKYIVYLPSAADATKARPVILGFHGAWGTGESFEQQSKLHDGPRASEFVIVYPSGYHRSWNVGACCGDAKRDGIDDVKFVERILQDLRSLVRIDERRIYATGFSNGAMMSYQLACARADLIAAIAPAGAAMQGEISTCRPSRPVPVLHFHGGADGWSPLAGGKGQWEKIGAQRPIGDQIAFWAKLNSCRATEKVGLPGGANCTRHTQCRGDADVVLCVVDGMGHQWAGDQPRRMLEKQLGPGEPRIKASDAVLEFFRGHTLGAK